MFRQGQLAIHGLAILLGRDEAGISNRGKKILHHAVGIGQSERGQPDPINIVLQLNGVGIKRSHANSKSRQRGLGSEISRASAHHKNVRTKGQERVGHSDNFCVRDAYKKGSQSGKE